MKKIIIMILVIIIGVITGIIFYNVNNMNNQKGNTNILNQNMIIENIVTNSAENSENDSIEQNVESFAYYAPWGNISVFYKDFRYSNSLYKLGTIESGTEIFENMNNDFEVTIERVN